ncbi:MAG: hypothetical protein ABI325_11320 [Ginsengibacter sp.]
MNSKNIFIMIAVVFMAGCSKSDNPDQKPPEHDVYLNTNVGSTWTYHEDNSSSGTTVGSDYTLTSTNTDTSIGSKIYHIFSYSYGGSQYQNLSEHDYYQFDSIPGSGGITLERLYLKDNALEGTSWSQDLSLKIPNLPIPIPLKISNTIAEKGITRTVKGIAYADVIHVSSSLSSALITSGFTTSIDSYFAPKYGLIENTTKVDLNFMGLVQKVDLTTQLVSATLK